MRHLKFVVILAAGVFITWACAANQPPVAENAAIQTSNSPIPKATIDELSSGRKVYDQNCAACHKPDGTGGTIEIEGAKLNVDDLTSSKIKAFPDEKIIKYILNGVIDEGMPAFKDKLSDAEIKLVVKHVRTLQK